MPLLLLLLVVAALVTFASFRWRRTPEQRKAVLAAIQEDVGGEIEDFGDGGVLKYVLDGHDAELRLYAVPGEPLGVSTEFSLKMDRAESEGWEIVADGLGHAVKDALGFSSQSLSFERIFKHQDAEALYDDPGVREGLLGVWSLGPPRHTRLSFQDGEMHVTKDVDLCNVQELRRFVHWAEQIARAVKP